MLKQRTIISGAILAFALPAIAGPQVWSGYDYAFAKPAFADPSLPENQDRMTSSVWITRADIAGIYNAAQENSYSGLSPADTEWSFGTTDDYDTLNYQPWVLTHGNNPPSMVNQPMVVHLITDDIYIDVMFTNWGIGPSAGGTFSYIRGVPAPSALALLGAGGVMVVRRRRS